MDFIPTDVLAQLIQVAALLVAATLVWAGKKAARYYNVKLEHEDEQAFASFIDNSVGYAEEWARDAAKVGTSNPTGNAKLKKVIELAEKSRWAKKHLDETGWDEAVKAALARKRGLGATGDSTGS